jgi:hypothetical protein
MTEVTSPSAAILHKVVLPGQAGDAAMSAPEGAHGARATTSGSTGVVGPSSQAELAEEQAKEVTWHDQHGLDLTQVREFEPR